MSTRHVEKQGERREGREREKNRDIHARRTTVNEERKREKTHGAQDNNFVAFFFLKESSLHIIQQKNWRAVCRPHLPFLNETKGGEEKKRKKRKEERREHQHGDKNRADTFQIRR